MKKTLSHKILLLINLLLVAAGTTVLAQTFPMMPQPGKTMVYSVSAKTPMGVSNMFINQSIMSSDESSVVLSMGASLTEGGQMQNTTITYAIDNGEYVISLKDALGEALQQLQGKFEIMDNAEDLRYPITLDESSVLPDASMKIKATIQGMELEMLLSVKERKMQGKETITVPAGTFECIKFVENQVISLMGQEQVTQVTYWYGKDTGLVKQSTFAMGGMVAADLVLKEIK